MSIRGHLLFVLYTIWVIAFLIGVLLCSKIYRRRHPRHVPLHSAKIGDGAWRIANDSEEQKPLQKSCVRKLNTGLLADAAAGEQEANQLMG